MFKPITSVLERLAERCLALAASVLASTFESLTVKYAAEQQTCLEQLARAYESDGLPEVAKTIRERARNISVENPAAHGDAIVRLLLQPIPEWDDLSKEHSLSAASPASEAARRIGVRTRRAKAVAIQHPSAPLSPLPVGSIVPPFDTSGAAEDTE
jgi:hypothetical protein